MPDKPKKPDLRMVPPDGVKPDAHSEALLDRVVRKLQSIGELSYHERDAIRSLPGKKKSLRAYEDVVREGDRPSVVTAVLSGMLCRYKHTAEGARQIFSFHVPGDVPDAQSLFIERMDHSLGTLTETEVFEVPHEAVHELFKQHPRVAGLFWRGTLIEAAVFREWMLGLGKLEAYPRLARMLCEIVTMMDVVGLADQHRCALPVTQAEMADATGMSTVHVNRTLQALRANGLIELRAGSLTVLDWDGLAAAGEFDASYLHLRP